MSQETPNAFPHYQPGQVHVPTVKEMGQMTKVLTSRLAKLPRAPKMKGKQLHSKAQKVKIKKRPSTIWY